MVKYIICILFGTLSYSYAAEVPTHPLSFQEALEEILSRSTQVTQARDRLKAIQSRNLPSHLRFLPTLSVEAKEPLTGTESFLTVPRQVAFYGRLSLFKWGADLSELRAARSEVKSQEAAVNAIILEVEERGVIALIAEIQKQDEILIHHKIVKSRTDNLRIGQERFEAGRLALQEVQVLQIDLDNAAASYSNAQIQEMEARAQLENLLGHTYISLEWPWKETLIRTQGNSLLQKELVLETIPAWKSAEDQTHMEAQRLSQSWRQLLPALDVYSTYGHFQGYFGSVSGWTANLGVTFPLFDHLETYSRAATQRSQLAISESRLEQVKRDALATWSYSRNSFKTIFESAQARDRTVSLSRKVYNDNLKRFQQARASANDILIDINRLFVSELNAIQGWGAAHQSFSRLCHSLGHQIKTCEISL